MQLINLFRNEHIFKEEVQFDNFVSRLIFLQDESLLKIENQHITLVSSNKLQSPLLDLFVQMQQAYIDTYLIVALALDHICGKHIILKQKLLISELHSAIKHLYTA